MNSGDARDTIAAIATAPGEAGIAIVRVSGGDAMRIADAVFRCPPPLPSRRVTHTFVHGRVRGEAGEVDEGLLLIMRAPRSFTGEDTVEIQGHGGSVSAGRILRRVIEAGARLAEPGEFTRRAFLNGRLDLTQAEAVQDLIRARSDRAADAALEQLEGRLGRRVHALYDAVRDVAADVEASLDFPEDELPEQVLPELRARLAEARGRLRDLLATAGEGRLLREGARVVIAGRPNAGKSTLLNALLGMDRAIVSPHPGTTRDTIEEQLVLAGLPVRLVDTAGLREADCEVERSGIMRSMNEIRRADACLYVVDGTRPPEEADKVHLRATAVAKTLIVSNKMDLGGTWPAEVFGYSVVTVSATTGQGLDDLKRLLGSCLVNIDGGAPPPHAVIAERHRGLLQAADTAIAEAEEGLRAAGGRVDLAAGALRDALEQLGRITGRVYDVELLDAIFSRFCIGK